MADPRLVRAVLALLEEVPAGRRALDVSCKRGEILRELRRRGFDAEGTNFVRSDADLSDLPVTDGVDLLRGLPFPDASFDVVLLVEVVEHLENHRAAIGELARVLRPGGLLVLTTPNVMRLSSRFHFLLSGFHKTKRRFVRYETPLDEAHAFHNYPIELPILDYLLARNGLALERVGSVRVKAFSWILFVLLYLPVAAYTAFFLRVREKDAAQRRAYRSLGRWLLHPRVLLEDNLVLRARKRSA